MAQMDEGQLSFDVQPLDLSGPIEQAVATIQPLATQQGVSVSIAIEGDLPPVLADAGRVQQVVFNLLDNGLRYTPAGGSMVVGAVRGGARVTVTVTDTGPGVEPDELQLVFERFHKRRSSGRGVLHKNHTTSC